MMRVGRRAGHRRSIPGRDRDGIYRDAWEAMRSGADAVSRDDALAWANWLQDLSGDFDTTLRVFGYSAILLAQLVEDRVDDQAGPEEIDALLSSYDPGFLEALNEDVGYDVVRQLIEVMTENRLAPTDPEEMVMLAFTAMASLGRLMPYPLAETTNRRARVAALIASLPRGTSFDMLK